MTLGFDSRLCGTLVLVFSIGPLPLLMTDDTSAQEARPGLTVVEVHQGGSGVGPLWYRVGRSDGVTIQWGNSAKYEDSGFKPAVAHDGDTVVAVHQAGPSLGPLWYRVGRLSGLTIQWGRSVQYDNGLNPAVALRNGTVVVVHEAREDRATLPMWSRGGRVSGSSIEWGDSVQYDVGLHPAVN